MAKRNRGGQRAAGSAAYSSADKTLLAGKPQTLKVSSDENSTVDNVLAAKTDGDGNLELSPVRGTITGGSRKYPETEYQLTGNNVITNKDNTPAKSMGIEWNNVETVSGKTYGTGSLLKQHGFVWHKDGGVWIKQKTYTTSQIDKMSRNKLESLTAKINIKRWTSKGMTASAANKKSRQQSTSLTDAQLKTFIKKYGAEFVSG